MGIVLEFPDDPACAGVDHQYMLGESLLVAPVFSSDNDVDYYLPPRRWTNFLTCVVVDGGRWVREQHDFQSLPLLARPNSLIAVGATDTRPDYEFADGVTLHLFQLDDGATATTRVPDLSGAVALTATAWRDGDTITVSVAGTSSAWKVLLRGIAAVASCEGGDPQTTAFGTLVTPHAGRSAVTVRLARDE